MSIIARPELRHGYQKAVENAFALLQAAMSLTESYPSVALGLAEIGQEELGKSLTCLAAIALPQDSQSFRWFWKAWKDHRLKAYRAHLYELISPTRLEVVGPDGSNHLGISERAHIPLEKEVSFYVNYDPKGGFLSPRTQFWAMSLITGYLHCSIWPLRPSTLRQRSTRTTPTLGTRHSRTSHF